jgi:hypothetical protein
VRVKGALISISVSSTTTTSTSTSLADCPCGSGGAADVALGEADAGQLEKCEIKETEWMEEDYR